MPPDLRAAAGRYRCGVATRFHVDAVYAITIISLTIDFSMGPMMPFFCSCFSPDGLYVFFFFDVMMTCCADDAAVHAIYDFLMPAPMPADFTPADAADCCG